MRPREAMAEVASCHICIPRTSIAMPQMTYVYFDKWCTGLVSRYVLAL